MTGAFGNVGRNTLPQLVERGHRVRALSYDWPRDRKIARAFGSSIEVVRGDVRDRATMARALRDITTVVHLAFVIPPGALAQPAIAESVNVGGTRTVLEAASAATAPPRVLFASTLDVYGHTAHLPPPRRVGDPLNGTDAYGLHKIACEELVRNSGLRAAIFRFADVPPIEVRTPHPIMFSISLATRIEAIHPRDAGLAITNALETDSVWGRTLNIGGGATCQVTYGDYLGAFLDAMGIGRLPPEAFSHEPYCTDWLDTDESQRALRYQQHSFDDIVRETAALLGWRAPLARMARPLVRAAILRLSPAWRARARAQKTD
ncbi:MAG: NAD(P)-dependent oxidoreductase [Deltaproteobacteria bacterium]